MPEEKERIDLQDIIDTLMADPEFLVPCLDAPTMSVVLEDPVPADIRASPKLPNVVIPSPPSNCSSFLNRLSIHAGSQELLNAIKRLSGSQGIKVSPQKPGIKTLVVPPYFGGRPRSNSIGTPQASQKDSSYDFLKEIQCANNTSAKPKEKPKRYSEEFHRSSSYHRYLLLNNGDKADASSDYFSDSSKDTCLYMPVEMCETVTSV